MKDNYTPEIKVVTGYWIPTIVKVENGYIVTLQSPSQPVKEMYVFNGTEELSHFLSKNFDKE